jgi:maltooligosyltrehalose trehalohydrolase
VRNHFIQNALMWLDEYHLDGLRLDAVHAIYDHSAKPFLAELAERVDELSRELGQPLYLIAESDLNDTKVISPREEGGFGHHAQWCDDFHHALHAVVTGEDQGYYADFGKVSHLAKAFAQGYVLDGCWSDFRKRRHGNDPFYRPPEQFVFCNQNHDQVGNRMLGERLTELVSPEALRLVAAATILAPGLPMLFMGEEWAETAPFLYFISHGDEKLVKAVQKGRKAEFKAFGWRGKAPDPAAEETFDRSKLDWTLKDKAHHAGMLALYKSLIGLRRDVPALADLTRQGMTIQFNDEDMTMTAIRRHPEGDVLLAFNCSAGPAAIEIKEGGWVPLLDVQAETFGGMGSRLPAEISQGGRLEMPAYGAAVLLAKGSV